MVSGIPRQAWLKPLDRKLARDLWDMKMQALAIALVIAGGVSVALLAAGMLTSLEETRRAYYDRYLFADIWAPVVRAPNGLIEEIRTLPGVLAADTRIRTGALFDIQGMSEPASGEVLSLPDTGDPTVNRLHLVRGRLPSPGQREEVVLLQAFADAHGLDLGDRLSATIYGGRGQFHLVGIALSPEHVYTVAPGDVMPDDRLFGVMWMGRRALAGLTNQDGAFNQVVVRLALTASEAAVMAELDRLLAPYGASGAYGREDQLSDAFVSTRIEGLRTMGRVLPTIFLLVAAFLVHVVIARIIAVQRAGIGLLKAFGYGTGTVIGHYLKLVSVIALVGLAIGGVSGVWLGRMMAGLYVQYFRFPFLVFEADPGDYALIASVALTAVMGAAALAVRRVSRLNPAEAMTAPAPPDYSKAPGVGLTRLSAIDQQTRMILRQVIRWPWRAGLTVAGIGASVTLLVGTLFFMDSMRVMIDVSFNVASRYDVAVTLTEPRSRRAYFALARAPGVLEAEPFRIVRARLRHGNREERISITGLPAEARLSRVIDEHVRPVELSPAGLVLSDDVADKLGVAVGDVLQIAVTEGPRPVLEVPLADIATTYVGSSAHLPIETLNALLREGPVVSGVYLTADPDRVGAIYTELKRAPGVAGVTIQARAVENLTELLEETIGVSMAVYTFFAGLITLGVIYNSVRISFGERQRELASLRVLGFSRNEVSYILLGEVAFLTLLALPLGAGVGAALAGFLAKAMASEMFRLPFVIEPSTFGFAAAVVVTITIASSLLVRRQINRLDMVAALKTGE